MANTIDWGQGAVNNTIDWGKGKTNATNNWGSIYDSTAAGETNITGSGGVTPFVNEYSMSFDGVDEYFNGASTFSALDGQNNFTFSFWIKPTNLNNTKVVFSIGNGSADFRAQQFYVEISSIGQIFFYLRTMGYYAFSNGLVISANVWQHVLICRDETQAIGSKAKIFVNGVDVTNNDSTRYWSNTTPATTPLMIGEHTNGYLNPTLGNIDEFAIWATDERANVSDIYNGGVPFDLSTLASAPSHWWRMGDGDSFGGGVWTLNDNIGSYNLDSVNMEEGDRLPISPSSFSLNSFSFDGVDEYFNAGNPASLQITGNLTLSAWINKDASATASNYTIIGKDSIATGFRSYLLMVNSSTNKAEFYIWKSGIFSSVSGTTNISRGVWYHIMGVNDGNDLKIYVNGVLENTNIGGGGTIDNGTSPFEIGRRAAAPANRGYWNGLIDEVAVWNTDQSSNVSTIFNNGTPNDISLLSPLSWWRMGEEASWSGSVWTLTDQGSGGNNATSVNMEEADKTGDQPYVI